MDLRVIKKLLNKHNYTFLKLHDTGMRRVDLVSHFKVKNENGAIFFASAQKNPAQELKHRYLWQRHFYFYQNKFRTFSIPKPVDYFSNKVYSVFLQKHLFFKKPIQEQPIEKRIDLCLGVLNQIQKTPFPKKKLPLVDYQFPQYPGKYGKKYQVPTRFVKTIQVFQENLGTKAKIKPGQKKCIHGDINPNLVNLPATRKKRYCIDFAKASVADPNIDYAMLLVYTQLHLIKQKTTHPNRKSIEQKILSQAKNRQTVLARAISIHANKLLTIQRYQFHPEHPEPDYRQKRALIHIKAIEENALKAQINLNMENIRKAFV